MFKPTVFIGYDQREDEAVNVLEYSIKKYNKNVDIRRIIQSDVRKRGLYNRPPDSTAATEFSLTRFLVPELMEFKDWAVFMDCDMLITTDIMELFELADPNYAVMVVKHNHQPIEKEKMDNCVQTVYPKKNWSSTVLWNCGHQKNKDLTKEVVNSVSPAFLHRFWWLDESDVGELPITWNFLAEYYKKYPGNIIPKNIHFTNGMPFMAGYENCDYSEVWYQYQKEMNESRYE